jgi:glycosyltransferase involved in cell wall biosynthesis
MIYFDTTKTGRRGRRSGLDRVSARLRESLGTAAKEIVWDEGARDPRTRELVPLRREDTFLTSELFSEAERPGFTALIASRPCRLAAIFHDAIPLKHPHITWPQSVARHPGYMKLLAGFDRIWAVSETSRADLLGFWSWQGVSLPPPVHVLALGADVGVSPRNTAHSAAAARAQNAARSANAKAIPRLLCLGIIEPRKNQAFLLDVCAELWKQGMSFELHVGRVNPHFGAPIIAQLKRLRRTRSKQLYFHEAASDAMVAQLYASTRATIFPTIAEGCGLPLLESLWMGVPCVCSDLPVLRENADGGGCMRVALNDREAWKVALRDVLADHALHERLEAEAKTRPLPTWSEAGRTIATALADLSS